ncbi:hypothetical protein J2772_002949 [Chryseobacterium jejuense]|nr:hypothetical protein [Chryseobacterium jejuense]
MWIFFPRMFLYYELSVVSFVKLKINVKFDIPTGGTVV